MKGEILRSQVDNQRRDFRPCGLLKATQRVRREKQELPHTNRGKHHEAHKCSKKIEFDIRHCIRSETRDLVLAQFNIRVKLKAVDRQMKSGRGRHTQLLNIRE